MRPCSEAPSPNTKDLQLGNFQSPPQFSLEFGSPKLDARRAYSIHTSNRCTCVAYIDLHICSQEIQKMALRTSDWQRLPVTLAELCIATTLRCGQSFRFVPLAEYNNLTDQWQVAQIQQRCLDMCPTWAYSLIETRCKSSALPSNFSGSCGSTIDAPFFQRSFVS